MKGELNIDGLQVMEKLRAAIQPEKFTMIKLTKSTLEFLRFDAEIENKKKLSYVITRIDQKVIYFRCFHFVLNDSSILYI